jgi:hypothetical protein
MACPSPRQVDRKAHISGLNDYCDAEEVWRPPIPTLLEEAGYCHTEDYSKYPVLNTTHA